MGRRPGDAESLGTGLAQDDSGNVAKLAADFSDERFARSLVRLTAMVPLIEQGFDSGRSRAHEASRPAIEIMLFGVAGVVPGAGDPVVEVVRWSVGKAPVDQSKSMTHARQPRHRLGIRLRPRLGFVLRNQMKHESAVSGQG